MFKISQYPPLLFKIKTTSLNGLHELPNCYLQHLWQYFLLPSFEIFFIHTRSLCFCKNDRYSSALGPLHMLTQLTGMSFIQLLHMFLLDLPGSLIKYYIFNEASPKVSVYHVTLPQHSFPFTCFLLSYQWYISLNHIFAPF